MHELGTAGNLDALLEAIGDRRIVMLGEATHGTHEFYTWRTAISKRLIEEKGFRFIAVEGDWPDCYRINRYIKHLDQNGCSPQDVLRAFDRWPTWMWSNWEVAALMEGLRNFNAGKARERQAGFYGLDVYSLWDSMKAMIGYLEREDPQAAAAAREAVHCFEPYQEDEQRYARFTMQGHSCRDEVVALLKEIRLRARHLDGDPEAVLDTEQNAHIAVNAERYYSAMIGFDNESWNIRDTHMTDTLDRLLNFHGKDSKAIVWAHNTHIGDARATDMKRAGMINIGQLAREQWGLDQVFLVGFGTYEGRVIAGSGWGEPMQEMEVPPARLQSIEEVLHREQGRDHYLLFNGPNTRPLFTGSIRHRAIGVVYHPGHERNSNYVPTVLSKRYDAFLFLDQTTALHPLGVPGQEEGGPQLYPFGI